METTTISTADKLAMMLTENTGKHLLDSGNAYGRAWERNQGMTTADFMAQPTTLIDEYGATLTLFHWLHDRLDYAADVDAMWSAYDAAHPDDSWFYLAEQWTELVGEKGYWSDFGWVNSYNHDNYLNGTIQFLPFTLDGNSYVLLQIHGGADVRGGYTKPVVFAADEGILCFSDITLYCTDCGDYIDYTAGHVNDLTFDEFPTDWEPHHGCPDCGAAMN